MKKDIHPEVHPVIFIDTSCGKEFFATSTLTSEKTRDVAGTTYAVLPIEISSASHPFYTGKQTLLDTARRAEKFAERAAKRTAVSAARKGKKIKRAKIQATRRAKTDAKKTPEKPAEA